MRQRVMIAMALSCNPRLLIADEPTTALDVTIQAQILDLIGELKDRLGMAVVLITHDLGVVAQRADEVAVMYAGRIVERAKPDVLFARPLHPYTVGLMNSIPSILDKRAAAGSHSGHRAEPARLAVGLPVPHPLQPRARRLRRRSTATGRSGAKPLGRLHQGDHRADGHGDVSTMALLDLRNLTKFFSVGERFFGGGAETVRAVDDVTLSVEDGETLGIVGEFGLRQVHARTLHHPAARTDRGQDHLRRPGHHEAWLCRDAGASPQHADHFSGSLRRPQPAHAGGRDRRRRACDPWLWRKGRR